MHRQCLFASLGTSDTQLSRGQLKVSVHAKDIAPLAFLSFAFSPFLPFLPSTSNRLSSRSVLAKVSISDPGPRQRVERRKKRQTGSRNPGVGASWRLNDSFIRFNSVQFNSIRNYGPIFLGSSRFWSYVRAGVHSAALAALAR